MVSSRTAAALLVGVIAAACGDPKPSPSPSPVVTEAPGPPISATARKAGVVVTVDLDAGRIAAGGVVRAVVEVTNAGGGRVWWSSGGCGLREGLSMAGPALEVPGPGRGLTGTAALVKLSATIGGVGIAQFVDPGVVGLGFDQLCTLGLETHALEAGATVSAAASWQARTSDGRPAPPGTYMATFDFPFLGRGRQSAAGGGPGPVPDPIGVRLDVEVTGEPWGGIDAVEAVDAGLADLRVAGWLAGITREELLGAEIQLAGDAWELAISVDSGVTHVRIDPGSGRVIAVSLAP